MKKIDVVIVGAGPAGLSASVYLARYNLKCVIIGKVIGGMAITAHKICNFPSYNQIPGYELMKKMREQAKELGVEIVNDEVVSVEGKDGEWRVISASGEGYSCKKILIASGTRRKELGVNGEHKYVGRGLSYCATCDAAFYNGKTVAVVGGSNAALSSALLLSEIADRVYLIYRGEKFVKAEQAWVKMAKKNKKIEFMLGEEIVGIEGEEKVKGVVLKSGKKVKVDGIFVDIGAVPENGLAKGIGVKLDREGYVIIDDAGRTNLKGVYAAGDVTNRELKQIITACAQGSIAAYSIYKDNL